MNVNYHKLNRNIVAGSFMFILL